jgi:hypothetical protein
LLIIASVTTTQQQVYAGKEDKNDNDDDDKQIDYDGDGIFEYTNWDGRKFNEKQYQTRLQYCIQMAFKENLIDVNTPCREWVLTYEGDMKIADYIVSKYLKN